ncbi:BatD family protein [Flavobacterium sp. MK4S-17]|uniref:BatD family protein n=1 Tax=Flavobacterium sp. MK4S-17 TaxID=2543737 RepID=UPI001357752E|nr:BatD family protein [Flavobacterium sp. MK4S-17]
MKKYILLLLLCIQGLYAQVEFKAVPSKTTLGVNERLRVEFTMNEDGDNFVPPSFDGFRVSGPSQMISNSWINGKRTFSKSYTYVLTPTSRGSFTIGQASIEIDGKNYKTIPFKVTVTDAVQNADTPSNPNNPYNQQIQNAGEGLHLVAEVNNSSPYVNQPVTVVYKLYVSHNTSVRNWREVATPQFNDFWSQNIDIKDLVVEEGQYNGQSYRYVVLRKTVLYPQKSGRLEIEPLSLDIMMDVPTGRRDFFGQPFMTQANRVVSSGKKYINVKALPENGKPADFTGAVGSFDFKVKPSKTTLHGGESLQLEVSVTGRGNLKLFTLPKPVVPAALEMYDPEHKENVSVPLTGMQGKISDTYTIVAQNKGKYPIKALSFSWFDPAAGKYKTITSDEIMVNVLDNPAATGTSSGQETAKRAVDPVEQFRFVDLDTSLQPIGKDDFFGSGLFYLLLFTPFLLIPIIVLAKKKKEAIDSDVTGNRIRQNNRLAKKYLSEAKKHLGNKEPFYVALEKALHNFLKAKLSIETSEMSKPNISELLLTRNAKPETVKDLIKIMDSCEFARYAPSSGAAMQQDYQNAVTVITALEKQI